MEVMGQTSVTELGINITKSLKKSNKIIIQKTPKDRFDWPIGLFVLSVFYVSFHQSEHSLHVYIDNRGMLHWPMLARKLP